MLSVSTGVDPIHWVRSVHVIKMHWMSARAIPIFLR